MTSTQKSALKTLDSSLGLDEQKMSWTSKTASEVLSGCVAGFVQVIVGQPFDTVKVRLQTQTRTLSGQGVLYSGALDCIQKNSDTRGAFGFLQGYMVTFGGYRFMYIDSIRSDAIDETSVEPL